MPKMGDWRDFPVGDWRAAPTFGVSTQPRMSTGMRSSYTDLLPESVRNKPAFTTPTSSDFWNQIMGQSPINKVVDTFGGNGVGKVASKPGFGQFANSPGVDNEILAAATKYGVPANYLKAIIAAESSGDWARNNRTSNIRPNSGPLLPYVGVFQDAADSRGLGTLFQQAYGNRAKQIELLAGVLRSQYDQIRRQNPQYGWLNVASYHYSGRPVPDGWEDEGGNGTNNQYMAKIENWWRSLDAYAGNAWNNYTAPSSQPQTAGTISSMFGGSTPRISQEFGRTSWSTGAGAYMYDYAARYGMPGGHPGIDYSMPTGNKLYTPVSGTVIRAGGSGSYLDDRYGNRAGTGELRIKLDNGDEFIIGHMQSINFKVGQRVSAGALAGLSGTANGGHAHVEYRQYAPGKTVSNYLAIDPRKVFTGRALSPMATTVHTADDGHNHGATLPVSGLHGAGIEAARQAMAQGLTSADLPRLVYDEAFRQSALQRAIAA